MPSVIDLTGERFGRLVVKYKVDNGSDSHVRWHCECDCGGSKEVRGQSLRQGRCKSCGCLHKEKQVKHKMDEGEAALNILFNRYKRDAIKRNYDWSLSREFFKRLTKECCHYCGAEPERICTRPTLNGGYVYNGIDRKDSTKGYTEENSVAACFTCNKMKSNLDYEEFISFCKKIALTHTNQRKDYHEPHYQRCNLLLRQGPGTCPQLCQDWQ